MQENDSMTSRTFRVGFFGGVSPTNSIRLLHQNQLISIGIPTDVTHAENEITRALTWQYGLLAANMTHTIALKEDPLGIVDWKALCTRIYCYHLLDHMPDEGLGETLTDLAENYEYYSTPRLVPQLAQPVHVQGVFSKLAESP